jgi:hypothetical protein
MSDIVSAVIASAVVVSVVFASAVVVVVFYNAMSEHSAAHTLLCESESTLFV